MLKNINSNLCNDHDNKINVLPQLEAPFVLFKFSKTKGIVLFCLVIVAVIVIVDVYAEE
jgi:hypothetical protein